MDHFRFWACIYAFKKEKTVPSLVCVPRHDPSSWDLQGDIVYPLQSLYILSILIYIILSSLVSPLRHPPLDPVCFPFLFFCFLSPLLFHRLLRCSRQFPPPSHRQAHSCPNPTHQNFLHIHTGSSLENFELYLVIKLCINLKSKIISKFQNNKPWEN